MKKTYIAPLTDVVKMGSEEMICVSGGERLMTSKTSEASGNLDKDYDEETVFDELW